MFIEQTDLLNSYTVFIFMLSTREGPEIMRDLPVRESVSFLLISPPYLHPSVR